MKTVAVIEGFSGGPKHTAKFRQALSKAGYKVIKNARQADIVVAHSAGIYNVPVDTQARLLVLIGPTYWPGKSLIKRVGDFSAKARSYYVKNYGWRFYIRKKAWEVFYFFTRHKYMWLGIFHNNRLEKLELLANYNNRKIIIVRGVDESFTTPAFKSIFKRSNVRHVELPGVHDQFTVEPQLYINLIKQAMR